MATIAPPVNFISSATKAGTVSADSISFSASDVAQPWNSSNLRAFTVNAGDGNDIITQTITTSAPDFQHNFINGGVGVDTFKLVAPAGAQVLISDILPSAFTLNGKPLAVTSPQLAIENSVDHSSITYLSGVEKIVVQQSGVEVRLDKSALAIDVTTGSFMDSFELGSGADVVRAGGGNDRIKAGSGNDKIYGESGDDQIVTGDGNDYANGGTGNDRIDAYGTGNDSLWGGDGNDFISGGLGNDVIVGGKGHDDMRGGEGRDVFYWASSAKTDAGGVDKINGDSGFDTMTFAYSQTGINLFSNQDGIVKAQVGSGFFASQNNATLFGIESIVGSSLGDTIDFSGINSGDLISNIPRTLSMGAGGDTVILNADSAMSSVTLGTGADALIISDSVFGQSGPTTGAATFVMVNDFKASEGDILRINGNDMENSSHSFALTKLTLADSLPLTIGMTDSGGNPAGNESEITKMLQFNLENLDSVTKNSINSSTKSQLDMLQNGEYDGTAYLSITDAAGKVFVLSVDTDHKGNVFYDNHLADRVDLIGVVTTGAGMDIALM